MIQDSRFETFAVKKFSPHEPMPVAWIEDEWTNNRLLAWDVLNGDVGGLNKIERAVAPLLPIALMGSIMVLLFSVQLQFSTTQNSTFIANMSSPMTLLSTVFLSLTLMLTYKVTKTAERLRNVADKTIFSVMNTWIKSRYGITVDYGENLIRILNNETIIIGTSPKADYFLGTAIQYGETVLVVRNIEGEEAPLLYV